MFDSEVGKDSSSVDVRRRAFLGFSVSAIAGAVLWSLRKPSLIVAAMPKGDPGEVTIVQFSDSGQKLQRVHVPKIVKSDDEWRQQLSANAFDITRHADTEFAFSGKYWNEHRAGIYRCAVCGQELFDSKTKFESGTGWPSFYAPKTKDAVIEHSDSTHGMVRTEVRCSRCQSHLGHVFEDGPQPTGMRYCMNSAVLDLKVDETKAKEEKK
jgi:peptide-methionine (R)-S-oxide reductase